MAEPFEFVGDVNKRIYQLYKFKTTDNTAKSRSNLGSLTLVGATRWNLLVNNLSTKTLVHEAFLRPTL
jgi:hypothetical protein